MSVGTDGQQVEQGVFAVGIPETRDQAVLGGPAVMQSALGIRQGGPVHAVADPGREGDNPGLVCERGAHRDDPGDEQGGVDGGRFAAPHACAVLGFDEVVEVAVVMVDPSRRKRRVVSARATAAARGSQPRWAASASAVRPNPVAAMLATGPGSPPEARARSATRPVAGCAVSRK